MNQKYTLERVIKVWDNEFGCHIYVGPDADGLGCAEIRYVDENNNISDRIAIPSEMMLKVAEAIIELYGVRRNAIEVSTSTA